MKKISVVSLFLFLSVSLYAKDSLNLIVNQKYKYVDTGYVLVSQPHFMSYFIISDKKSLKEVLSQDTLHYFGVYSSLMKDFYLDSLLSEPSEYSIKTNFSLYSGVSHRQSNLLFFKAAVIINIDTPT